MEASTDTLYTASLEGAPSVPTKERITAETRYCSSLERSLGGPEGVAKAYFAWCSADETDSSEISAETAELATSWAKAANKAR